MPPPPPKTFDKADSDSDSDAPEAVSLKAASKQASQEERSRNALQEERRRKEKERRREADRKLKAQKEEKRERQQEEAQATVGSSILKRSQEEGDKQEEGWGGADEDVDEVEPWITDGDDVPDYLPDEIFQKAAAEARTVKQIQEEFDDLSDSDDSIRETLKRKRKSKKTKLGYEDKVVGSRVIRRIEKPALNHLASVSSAAPPAHARKFLKRSLGLSNNPHASTQPSGKRFTRRPVTLGILKGAGPAGKFARSLQT